MSILQVMEWLNGSAAANAMNGPEWAFPVVESLHFAGFALSIGTIAIVDLRLLGFGMHRQSASDLATDLAPWTLAGLAIMLITGPLMFCADAVTYYVNSSFRLKMVCLAIAILYNFTVHRWACRSGTSPIAGRLVAAVSLALWTTVVAGGRMIAFV